MVNDLLRGAGTLAACCSLDSTDGELLELLRTGRRDAAFVTLVRRHGPMVWGVCRRVLRDAHRAEDAFQATFLVLLGKAAAIHKSDSLASWLHGVAFRVAARARSSEPGETARGNEPAGPDPADECARRELRAVLDEELNRLPVKYRVPLVLCYFQEKSQEEAAQQLGCPRSSLASRLDRAKALLHERLTRRGLALSLVGLGATLAAVPATAKVPTRLLASAIENVPGAAAGLPGALAPGVIALTEGVLRTMSVTKTTTALALVLALTAGLSVPLVLGDQPAAPAPRPKFAPDKAGASGRAADAALFRDVTAASGVAFTYRNGEEADQFTILESLGGGVVLIDFDSDGLLDVFLPGGGYFAGADKTQIKGHPCALYKNLGNFKFKNVTKQVGLDQIAFYTHGGAVVDYDLDGYPDLFVTGYGRVALFHNEPDGAGRRFVDVTEKAGLKDDLWSTSAVWADLDGDGFPDLYVCHYLDWSFKNHPKCTPDGKSRDICPPRMFNAQPHKLFRNRGDGTFTDVSKEAGLRTDGMGVGVVAVDFNGDGKPDLFVGNDTSDHFLYLNRSTPGKIRLEEVGLMAGVARDDRGIPTGCGGVAVGDYDNSGRPAVLVATHARERPSFYLDMNTSGGPRFRYHSLQAGLGQLDQQTCGWGTGFCDLDLDGRLDLFIARGHTLRYPTGRAKAASQPTLLRNADGRFVEFGDGNGPYFQKDHRGRGAAFGDLDNDGRVDLVVSHLNEPVVLLRNELKVGEKHWFGIDLRGKSHRSVTGAQVTLEAGGQKQTRQLVGGGSFASTSDSRLVFGLSATKRIAKLTVRWPNGTEQSWEALEVDRYHRLVEGEK